MTIFACELKKKRKRSIACPFKTVSIIFTSFDMPRKGQSKVPINIPSDQSATTVFENAAAARLRGGTKRPHRSTGPSTSTAGPSTQPSEPKPGSERTPTRPTETPNETVRRRILASAEDALKTICSKPWVTDKAMMERHGEAVRSVISEYSKEWKESLLPFEDWNSYQFGADATLDHEKYGVRIIPCSAEFSKQVCCLVAQNFPLTPCRSLKIPPFHLGTVPGFWSPTE
jgi:hypothetical protein